MIYDNMRTPSKNMKISNQKINEMIMEQQEELYAKDREKYIREQRAADRDREEYYTQSQNYINNRVSSSYNRANFLSNVKEAFITECIFKLYKDSTLTPMTERDKTVARNMITGFVKENGAGNLITDFATKNILLSEMSRICTKYYDKVLEGMDCKKDCDDEEKYSLDTTIKDDFYSDLNDLDTADASKLIKDRVSDAIEEFIDTNSYAKMDYEDIISQAKDKIKAAKDDETIEEITNLAKRKINDKKLTRNKNIFNLMVESLTRKAITDDKYRVRYVNESKVDIDSVVDDTQLVYTMLEMVNTTNMINIDEKFINNYINTL